MTDNEIVDDLILKMSDEDKQSWDIESTDLIQGHHNVGMFIRNEYKLWYVTDQQNRHADDRSMDIMCSIWKKLNPSKTFKGYC